MADFHQTGVVTTLHRLGDRRLDALEGELRAFADTRPIALVLPCLYAEFSRPAIGRIVDQLREATYLDTIVLSLGRATLDNLRHVQRALACLPQRVRIIWNDGPAMRSLYRVLGESGVDAGEDGKGRSCWIAYGYLLADARCRAIVSHDCDITTYSRELLARLAYPIVNPALGFEFAKGYYARVGTMLHGRVTRLFVTPLIRSLAHIIGPVPLLEYIDSFRYPLAGEFAMGPDVARTCRVPGNWGLEIGLLADARRATGGVGRICQAELCANYDHKHQALSAGDPAGGLLKMSIDIGRMLLRAMAADGVVVTAALAKTLLPRYRQTAADMVDAYRADASINGLAYDRHGEEEMVEVFGRGLRLACAHHDEDPLGVPVIPSWDRVVSAVPDVFERLQRAVLADSAAMAVA